MIDPRVTDVDRGSITENIYNQFDISEKQLNYAKNSIKAAHKELLDRSKLS